MLTRIWHIIVKEFIQFRRDRLLTLFLFTIPVMQLVLLVHAASSGVVNLPTAVLDQDHSRASRGLVQALNNTEELAIYYFPTSDDEVKRLLDSGQAALAVVIPPGFERDLFDPEVSPQMQIIVDGSNSLGGNTGLRTAEGVVHSYLRRLLVSENPAGPAAAVPLDLRLAIRFNRSLDHRAYTIPAQLAFIVYQVTLAVASLGLAREHELGTLEQLIVTPLQRFELLIGKAVPSAIIGLIDFGIMLTLVVRVYHVPMKGSWRLLWLLTALFILAEVSWGLLISSFSRTQQQAILFVFLVAMTDITLSGYLVPVEHMPFGLKVISIFSPIRHYMTILRAIMLKGADLVVLWPEALWLVALMIGVTYVSLRNVAREFE